MERYQDKKAVIIGGTSGMGLATAKMLLDGGARVLVTGRSQAGKGRVGGSIRGVDYQVIRADGRLDLDTRATIETPDGRRIALSASGVGTPRTGEPMADLFENVRFITAAADYAWLHTRETWAVGQVNFPTGKIHLEGYQQ